MTVDKPTYMVTNSGVISYICPVEVVRDTLTLWIVKTPRGRELRFHKRNGFGVGTKLNMIRSGPMPEVGPYVKMSNEAGL